jgi:hypothetical protein
VVWAPFKKDMLKFNFGPGNRLVGHLQKCIAAKKAGYFQPKSDTFESFDTIIYQLKKSLVGVQITENPHYDLNQWSGITSGYAESIRTQVE